MLPLKFQILKIDLLLTILLNDIIDMYSFLVIHRPQFLIIYHKTLPFSCVFNTFPFFTQVRALATESGHGPMYPPYHPLIGPGFAPELPQELCLWTQLEDFRFSHHFCMCPPLVQFLNTPLDTVLTTLGIWGDNPFSFHDSGVPSPFQSPCRPPLN